MHENSNKAICIFYLAPKNVIRLHLIELCVLIKSLKQQTFEILNKRQIYSLS